MNVAKNVHLTMDFIASIYRLQTTHELVRNVLETLSRLVDGDNVMIGSHDAAQRKLNGVLVRFPFTKSRFMAEANENGLIGEHPFWQRILDPVDRVKTLSEMVSVRAWQKNPFYRDVLSHDRAHDHINVEFGPSPSCFTTVGILRGRVGFTDWEKKVMHDLQPHFAQAFANAKIVDVWEQSSDDESSVNKIWKLEDPCEDEVMPFFRDVCFSRVVSELDTTVFRFREWFRRNRDNFEQGYFPAAPSLFRVPLSSGTIVAYLERNYPLLNYSLVVRTVENPGLIKKQGLTPREREVLGLAIQGKKNKEIARILGASLETIKVHFKNIFQKMEVDNRTAAVIKFSSTLNENPHGSPIIESSSQ